MMAGKDPLDRLSSAYRVEVEDDTRNRHLAEMGAAIRTAPPTPVPTGFALRRRLAGALAAVAVVVAPIGMAVAAEESVPGDFLYPMKQITERVRGFVDDDIGATHRVEEVERLMFTRAPGAAIARAVERAETATEELNDPTPLDSRLERIRERLRQQESDGAPPPTSDEPDGSEPSREGSPSGPPDEQGRTDDSGQNQGSGQGEQGTPTPDPGRPNEGPGGESSGEGPMTTTTHASSSPSGDGGAGPSSETDPARDGAEPGAGSADAPDSGDAGGAQGEPGIGERDGSGSSSS